MAADRGAATPTYGSGVLAAARRLASLVKGTVTVLTI